MTISERIAGGDQQEEKNGERADRASSPSSPSQNIFSTNHSPTSVSKKATTTPQRLVPIVSILSVMVFMTLWLSMFQTNLFVLNDGLLYSSTNSGTSGTVDYHKSITTSHHQNLPITFPNKQNNNTFGNALSTELDWSVLDEMIERKDEAGIVEFARYVFFIAFRFAVLEPHAPIQANCQPPPLSIPTRRNCSPKVCNGFTGKVLSRPRKVGHAIQFGFDVDNLEILLHELYDTVDRIFIVEWTFPHNQRLQPKPLAWEAVKTQSRFAFCLDKVVHILLDDVDAARVDPAEGWGAEDLQERVRWLKIMEWNNRTQFFRDSDLIGFGDTDEIPSRHNVQLLRYCEWKKPLQADVGIWFPMGRIDQAYRTDYPIGIYEYSIGDPTYHTFESAYSQYWLRKKVPSRNRGDSFYWIFGGAHFSHYGYLVYQILKQLSCTECDPRRIEGVLKMLRDTVHTQEWHGLELKQSEPEPDWKPKIIKLDQMDERQRKMVVYLPWFYNCNRDRYSMWEGKPDSRTA